jgi:hypothetical protein
MDRSQGVSFLTTRYVLANNISEAELLHHYITSAAQNPPQSSSQFVNQNFQLGGGGATNSSTGGAGINDVPPDQSVSTASSGKVAGSTM